MKRFSVLFFLFIVFSFTAYANNVSDIYIDVEVDTFGNAKINQRWIGEFSEGTENYIVIENLDKMKLSDFSVKDENGEFDLIEKWDINSSRTKKANKCGIVKTAKGYELCWGIGEYGKRTYDISYVIEGFVASYEEKDGSNFMYVNPQMSTFPTDVQFSLKLSDGTLIDDSIADVWAFGFDGTVEYRNGKIVAYTYSPLKKNNRFQIMFSLDKGIITPDRKMNSTFEKVKEKAFKGSDYEDSDLWIVILVGVLVGGTFISLIIYAITVSRERKKFFKSVDYFREVPNNSNLSMSYYLCRKFGVGGDEGSIIGSSILKMINDGNIDCETEKTVGFFGKEKESHNIKLVSRPLDQRTASLYDIMIKAAGSDGVLEENELKNYSSKNYKALRNFIDNTKEVGENAFCDIHGFTSGITHRIKGLSERGKKELSEVVGLKKYLDDFSLIDEREIGEIAIWKEYLIYATLFGSADKVLEQMKKIYPDSIPEIETYSRQVDMSSIFYLSMYRSMINAEQSARSSGSGGRASFGGGGGFSGGGIGGGSR